MATPNNMLAEQFDGGYINSNIGWRTNKPVYINSDLTVTGTTTIAGISLTDLTVTGNTTIGDAATDTLSVTGLSTFTNNSLTTGVEVSIASSATAITTTGRMFSLTHTGVTTTSGTLAEFSTLANDETILLALTGNSLTTGTLLSMSATGLSSGKALSVTTSSSSTDGGTSFEPALFSTTMTGVGGVGGRVRAYMTTNVALGAWSNALKGEVTYGASGRTDGLGSSILAEMTLAAGTTSGTYAPLEVELNLGSNAPIGTNTSFLYASANGTATNFIDSGVVLNLQGLGAAASGKIFQANTAAAATHALKILIGSTLYYIMLTDTGA